MTDDEMIAEIEARAVTTPASRTFGWASAQAIRYYGDDLQAHNDRMALLAIVKRQRERILHLEICNVAAGKALAAGGADGP